MGPSTTPAWSSVTVTPLKVVSPQLVTTPENWTGCPYGVQALTQILVTAMQGWTTLTEMVLRMSAGSLKPSKRIAPGEATCALAELTPGLTWTVHWTVKVWAGEPAVMIVLAGSSVVDVPVGVPSAAGQLNTRPLGPSLMSQPGLPDWSVVKFWILMV